MSRIILARHIVGALFVLLFTRRLEEGVPFWMTYGAATVVSFVLAFVVTALVWLFFTDAVRGRLRSTYVTWLWISVATIFAGSWATEWKPMIVLPWLVIGVFWWRWRRRIRAETGGKP